MANRKSPPKGAFSVNDAGRYTWERSDCAVRAVALAKGWTYAQAHAALKAAGRKDRSGTYGRTVSKVLNAHMVPSVSGTADRETYAQWLKAHRRGVFVVFVTGHFFAVVNGQQLDMGPSLYRPRQRVHGHWEITA